MSKKKIKKRIKQWESEIAESVDDINVQARHRPLTAKQIVKIGEGISYYQSKIAALKELLLVVN